MVKMILKHKAPSTSFFCNLMGPYLQTLVKLIMIFINIYNRLYDGTGNHNACRNDICVGNTVAIFHRSPSVVAHFTH